MTKNYKHIKETNRLRIYALILEGQSIERISQEVGVHRSTIYRELNRNSSKFGYRPDFASQQYLMRRRGRLSKIERSKPLEKAIIEKLKEGWSPQQISGRFNRERQEHVISHETIYTYIYSPLQKSLKLYKFLRKKRRIRYPRVRRKRHLGSKEKLSIHQRPPDINTRESFGHWEGDLILFSKTRENMFTLRERKTRFLVGIKNATRHARSTSKTLISYMHDKTALIDSLTLDNDTAFAEFPIIGEALGSKIYFCDPYKSWQKGAIENGNRLIREKLPLKSAIKELSQEDIDEKLRVLNSRPMKCLDYLSPREAFLQESLSRGIVLQEFALHP